MIRCSRLFLLNLIFFASWNAASMEDEPVNIFAQEMPIKGKTPNAFTIAEEVELFLHNHPVNGEISITQNEMPILTHTVEEVLKLWEIKDQIPIILTSNLSHRDRMVVDKKKRIIMGIDFLKQFSNIEIAASISHELVHYVKGHLWVQNFVLASIGSCVVYHYGILYALWSTWVYANGMVTLPPLSQLAQRFEFEADAYGVMALDGKLKDIRLGMLSFLIRMYFINGNYSNDLKSTIEENLEFIRDIENKKGPAKRSMEKVVYWLVSTHPLQAKRVEEIRNYVEGKSDWPKYKKYQDWPTWQEWTERLFCCCRDPSKVD